MLIDILGNEWSRKDYKQLARSLMSSSTTPLFTPIHYSTKSVKNNTLYDSEKEIYTLNETDNIDTQGLLTPFLDCYTPLCSKTHSNGCYAHSCPNKGAQFLSTSKVVRTGQHVKEKKVLTLPFY